MFSFTPRPRFVHDGIVRPTPRELPQAEINPSGVLHEFRPRAVSRRLATKPARLKWAAIEAVASKKP
jgi:hypothetical protein